MNRTFNYRLVYDQEINVYYIQRLYTFFGKKIWKYITYIETYDDADIEEKYQSKNKNKVLDIVLKYKFKNKLNKNNIIEYKEVWILSPELKERKNKIKKLKNRNYG
jgi:hypothetical protein